MASESKIKKVIATILIGNSFEIWLAEQWEQLIGLSPLLFPSPILYFEMKAQIDREKAREHLETYEEFRNRMSKPIWKGPNICRLIP